MGPCQTTSAATGSLTAARMAGWSSRPSSRPASGLEPSPGSPASSASESSPCASGSARPRSTEERQAHRGAKKLTPLHAERTERSGGLAPPMVTRTRPRLRRGIQIPDERVSLGPTPLAPTIQVVSAYPLSHWFDSISPGLFSCIMML
jgi:hypothetical protein